jgi:ribosome-interacting GTPase 1
VVPHATWEPVAGMLHFENLQVQLVDTPSLDRDYVEPRLKELIRHADLMLLVVDLQQDPVEQLKETVSLLEDFHIAAAHRRMANPRGRFTFLPFLVLVNKCDGLEDEEALPDLLRTAR